MAPFLTAALGLVALGWSDDIATDRTVVSRDTQTVHAAPRSPARPPLTGADFPDGVLALTWDDGPDANTVELARYLASARVSGTFFVVGEWAENISEEPGVGATLYETGYRHLPVLGELVALGHRLGGHTENHARLYGAADATVAEQVGQVAHEIDPYLTNELRIFRAPGGMWNRSAAAALTEPFFSDLVGPVHWDIDGKDWEGSLYCRSRIARECEPGPIPNRTRVRPEVIARRYLALAERDRHGIVLMHDRVGDVGSRYALDIAKQLVPALVARGFVFASPLLAFGSLSPRLSILPGSANVGAVHFADVDGDGREDMCRVESDAVVCARASAVTDARALPHATLDAPRTVLRLPGGARAVDFADVDGDRRADVCVVTDGAIECALSRGNLAFQPFQHWSNELTPLGRSSYAASFRLADVDGDGRADACVRSGEGILCATSAGANAFGHPRVWLDGNIPNEGAPIELADLNGDGRADVCGSLPTGKSIHGTSPAASGITCAVSNGHAFGTASTWTALGDFANDHGVRLADLNGDGRADICAIGEGGIACALSNGFRFKHSSLWSEVGLPEIQLADINGDGRADLCAVTNASVDCGLAP